MVVGRYPPTLTVGSTVIPAEYDPVGLTGIAEIRIRWGQADRYAPVDPSTVAVDVLDSSGQWSTDPARYGEEITVKIPHPDGVSGPRVIFRGAVTETRSRRVVVDDRPMWRTTLYATDVLADLARDPLTDGRVFVTGGTGMITLEPSGEAGGVNQAITAPVWVVKDRLWQGGINRYVSAITNPPTVQADQSQGKLGNAQYPTVRAVPSWLDYLYSVWRCVPFVGVVFDPHTRELRGVEAATAKNLTVALVYTGGLIQMSVTAASGPSPIQLPARRLSYSGDFELSSTIQAAITGIAFRHAFRHWAYAEMLGNRWFFAWYSWVDTTEATYLSGTPSGAVGRNIDVNLSIVTTDTRAPASVQPGGAIPEVPDIPNGPPYSDQIMPAWRTAVAGVNGFINLPELFYDLGTWPADPVIDAYMLTPYARGAAAFLQGSFVSGLPSVPTVVEAISGELHWMNDWEVSMQFAPVPATYTGGGIAINALVTTPEPTLNQYAPGITLGDLGKVTKGI
jgi:hypothetical protein